MMMRLINSFHHDGAFNAFNVNFQQKTLNYSSEPEDGGAINAE